MRFQAYITFFSVAAGVLLPPPTGRFPVSVAVKSLTDESRVDPYSPPNQSEKRQVLVSLFLPIDADNTLSEKRIIPYMTPVVAQAYGLQAVAAGLPNNTFAAFELETSVVISKSPCGPKTSKGKPSTVPLVLFSPGGGQSRLLYGTMARSLASEGYAVVTIDHPYDASVVEFPDGKVVRAANISDEDIPALTKMTQVRAEDASFVLDQIKDTKTFSKELATHNVVIDFNRVIMYGHSQGGATAALAMLTDSRIKGGVNLDGRFFGAVMDKGLSRPFALLGRPNHGAQDKTWPEVFPKLRRSRFEMEVANTTHGSFTDFPVLIDSLGLPEAAKGAVAALIGTVSAKHMDKTIKSVMVAFSELVFKQNKAPEVLKKGQTVVSGLTVLSSDFRN